ncbi:Oidioi.mRNA.OKI2018_I69.chr2.g7525.t1.cds [Oikopleura dioica]|uniref:Phosphomevalonate kinase n=1 Tax=Oikopleura dioica TaxID=34765 RepID=A0ABN7T736_OIKDI|nr:Oidioi.mRNA.OKI2018_I69.chr2.g7525.t1.cds [Oikopleura dioica]
MIVLLSGKRKSGKDFVAEKLQALNPFSRPMRIIRLSAPLKKAYASEHPGVDYQQLMTSGEYKEKYRADMVRWGEAKRNSDPNYFVKLSFADLDVHLKSSLVVVSDCRRKTDIESIKKLFDDPGYHNQLAIVTVRIEATREARESRGFTFTAGIDDCETECGLDDYPHDFIFKNDSGGDISPLIDFLDARLEAP